MSQLLSTFCPIACATGKRESRRLPRITQRDLMKCGGLEAPKDRIANRYPVPGEPPAASLCVRITLKDLNSGGCSGEHRKRLPAMGIVKLPENVAAKFSF